MGLQGLEVVIEGLAEGVEFSCEGNDGTLSELGPYAWARAMDEVVEGIHFDSLECYRTSGMSCAGVGDELSGSLLLFEGIQ